MPGKYRVELTAAALTDLNGILEFIAQDSPTEALRWLDAMERRIRSLERAPLRCAVIPETAELGREYRHLLFGNYRAIYRVEGVAVWVIRVIHGAQLLDTSALEE